MIAIPKHQKVTTWKCFTKAQQTTNKIMQYTIEQFHIHKATNNVHHLMIKKYCLANIMFDTLVYMQK